MGTKPRSRVDADLFVTEVLGDGTTTDGDEQQLGLVGLAVLEGHDDTLVVLGDALEPDTEREFDAALAECALELLGDRLLLVGDEVGERLDDGHLCAERAPDARELDADDAAAEHGDLLGHEVELECMLARDHAPADLEAGKGLRVRAGGEHDVLADVAVVADLHGVRGDEAALALDDGDAARLQQALQALPLARDDALAVRRDGVHVDALERGLDAVLGGVLRDLGDLGRVQQRLGRDAAAVQTCAAQLVLLDHHGGQAEFDGADRRGITRASAAQDDNVKVLLGQPQSPLRT